MTVRILIGDCRDKLRELPDASVHCCVTSPPYFGLRDYGVDGQMGLEPTPDKYVAGMVEVFREVRRVLRDDGVLWLNIGDSYAGSWGAQGRQGETGQMATRAVSQQRGRSKISAAQIAAHPQTASRTGSIRQPGLKPKDLIGIPWLLAFALRADGWYLRQDIIWSKPNPMPESVRDRCTKAHEYIFMLSKSPRYFYDAEAISQPLAESTVRIHSSPGVSQKKTDPNWKTAKTGGHSGLGNGAHRLERSTRNKRSVWEVGTQPYADAHFAVYPPALIEPCVLAGCPSGGIVLDPFGGAGTTGLVADRLGRDAILIELNEEYAEIARSRLSGDGGMFTDVGVTA
jgi:DNA modification methylase